MESEHRGGALLCLPESLENTHFHGHLSDRNEVFRLMGNAKTIVSTSRYDAAPGILFEGSVMGCNLVASRNYGNWKICHTELLKVLENKPW